VPAFFADRKGTGEFQSRLAGYGFLAELPMESNPDDIQRQRPLSFTDFMGLTWYHVEIGREFGFKVSPAEGLPL